MITLFLLGSCLVLFGKLAFFAIKMAWGIGKLLLALVFAPLILVGMIVSGLFAFAIPILILLFVVFMIRGVFE